jgi:hypothetical protein
MSARVLAEVWQSNSRTLSYLPFPLQPRAIRCQASLHKKNASHVSSCIFCILFCPTLALLAAVTLALHLVIPSHASRLVLTFHDLLYAMFRYAAEKLMSFGIASLPRRTTRGPLDEDE